MNKPKANKNFKSKKSTNVNKPKFTDKRIAVNLKDQIKAQETGLKDEGVFLFSTLMSVNEFAEKIHKNPAEIIKNLFMKGTPVTLNTILSEEQIGELCLEFGYDFQKQDVTVNEENILENLMVVDKAEDLINRAPIVTIMGHVDHGKTSLLDKIRSTNVIANESGGITQHIGAYQIKHNGKYISFIDTPGHEAFTQMRARGASITDIVVLVVAADDGMKQQTIEALNHAKAAKVKIIVFINKMDKPDANPDMVKAQLAEHDLLVEEYGGNVMCIEGSAKEGTGLSDLLETIIFVAELMELKANPNRLAYGTVLEAHLDKGFGPVATFLIENGTLVKGDYLVLSSTTGKVRIMMDDNLIQVKKAHPSMPVKIAGLADVPQAGDKFLALKNEKDIAPIYEKISNKKERERLLSLMQNKSAVHLNEGEKKVNIILKTDVQGSLEALKATLNKLEVPNMQLGILNPTIGSINESDLQLAKVSNAVIFGFNVKPNKKVRELAQELGVMIRFHDVIYNLAKEVEVLMLGSLDPVEVETVLGEVQVLQLWRHSKIGTIAGCKVLSGVIRRNYQARVIRDGIVIYTSKISSLKHGKEDVREMKVNTECGFTLDNFQDLKENDIVEIFQIKTENQHEGLDQANKKTKKTK